MAFLLFWGVRLTKTNYADKYGCNGYAIGSDVGSAFWLSNDDSFGQNIIVFDLDNSWLVHAKNKKKIF